MPSVKHTDQPVVIIMVWWYLSQQQQFLLHPYSHFIPLYKEIFVGKFFVLRHSDIYLNSSGSRVLDAFNYERKTQIFYSCSVVLADKMWIFGGSPGGFEKQLSSVAQCHLKTEGKLPFELKYGAANTIEGFHGDQSALLCFSASSKECYS